MKKKENFDKLEDKFKNDPDIVLEALKNENTWGDSEIFKKLNDELKSNKEFLIKAVWVSGSACWYSEKYLSMASKSLPVSTRAIIWVFPRKHSIFKG